MKTVEREEARRLRREEGRSIRDIQQLLGVSKSSVSVWVRDIALTPEQHETLRRGNPAYDRQLSGRTAWVALCRERRRGWQEEGRKMARCGEPLHAAGAMLYWAEGGKGRNSVAMSNSDAEVLRFFVGFLRTYFDVPDEKIRIHCNLFADHVERQREVEQFWLDVLELPADRLGKSVVNVYSKYSQKKRKNLLPYGTCRLSVASTRILQHVYGAIQEYGGFDRPEWLN
jgi:hypothetical protein